ncbi:hypothetical protein LAT59_03575 [Candidatus Gracilibacteria bacterium]|nr:hypothetical protein [Candidatus Gracilibacteria bacterium]
MFQKLREQIIKGEQITPFLFVYNDVSELFYERFGRELMTLCAEFGVDTYSVYSLLRDNPESHKIASVKEFIHKGDESPRQAFQVFVFEDFGRLTPQSQNACLKFIEEPGKSNIIILTAPSLQAILDTILSRVQVEYSGVYKTYEKNMFFLNHIEEALMGDKKILVRYFFSQKIEKQEYLDFLKTLLYTLVEKGTHLHLHEKLHDDIQGIESNNFIARSIVDRYILEL